MSAEASEPEGAAPHRRAREGVPEPCALVIFGASGDLTRRKLLPALYNLHRERLLPERCAVVGFARTDLSSEAFRARMKAAVDEFSRSGPAEAARWDAFARDVHYLASDYDDPSAYRRLADLLSGLDKEKGGMPNRIFYLATSPSVYATIVRRIGEVGLAGPLAADRGFARLIVEKPFGRDLESAVTLNRQVGAVFRESAIYRIDHYLGKETVQNLLVFRFANGIFEPVWNQGYVDHVQITAAETLGVENRGAFYEEAGALRDVVQNHMLQLLCLTAMEPPVAFDERAVRNEKTKVLQAVRPVSASEVDAVAVRGQYGEGFQEGQKMRGYRQEAGVAADSPSETYAAVRLMLDNWRWAGVPFYLRTGKRLAKRVTEIAIQFKRPPHLLLGRTRAAAPDPNVLCIRIQPDEGILLRFGAKVPGPTVKVGQVDMDFRYAEFFGGQAAEAYERLLLDCLHGDPSLFARADWVELSWEILGPIQEGWATAAPPRFPNYDAGSLGPPDSDALLARDGRTWRRP